MNLLFHFLLSYLFVDLFFGNAWNYLIVIFVFSVLIDITHLPYLFKFRKNVIKKRFGSEARTRFHEIYGLTLFSAIGCLIFLFFNQMIVEMAALCMILHFAVDFVTGKSMPFYPYSRTEIFLGISPYGYKNKIIFEIISTVLVGVLFWFNTANLLL